MSPEAQAHRLFPGVGGLGVPPSHVGGEKHLHGSTARSLNCSS
jgi:hypothetical protein